MTSTLSKVLRFLGRPMRGPRPKGLVIKAYRGYGSRRRIFLIGRLYRQSTGPARVQAGLLAELRDVGRRITRRAVPDVAILASFYGSEQRVVTDADGYFRVNIEPEVAPTTDRLWHTIALRLESDPAVTALGEVFIPLASSHVVISDIDDTIVETGVANKAKMLWRLFVQDAGDRTPFPGVAALYQALFVGAAGDQSNPLLYVSRAPWGIYDVLDEFFARHRIPFGPILFLREWGLGWTKPFPRRAEDHKRHLINHMLDLYGDLPVVLIGDSGQRDPEIYRQVIAEHPGRVRAVYIRKVSRSAARIGEIEALATALVAEGSSLVLAADSTAIAEHAAALGLIAEAAVDAVRRNAVDAATPRDGRAEPAVPVASQDLAHVLESDAAAQPAAIVIEPTARATAPSGRDRADEGGARPGDRRSRA